MSLAEVYEDPNTSTMEEKFLVVKIKDNVYEGKYPLEMFAAGMRGVYGGDLVAQSLIAIWETIEDKEFSPHSMHGYFLKAGLANSPIRWEIQTKNAGRNYINKEAMGYQSDTNKLCFTLTASFTRNNNVKQRKIEYAEKAKSLTDAKEIAKLPVPFEFQRTPQYLFKKYLGQLDDMPYVEHINGNIRHIFPPEVFMDDPKEFQEKEIGMRDFGLFFKVMDDLSVAKNPYRTKFSDLAFASDSAYLSMLIRAVGLKFNVSTASYFRVSLDHALYFHDDDFDPTEWMFLDFRFSRMSNNRVLCQCQIFTQDGRMVLSIVQEALAFIPLKAVEKATGGSYKL